ncbi:MAG: protein adenylyltransferase SelO [Ostreibacterium sp.]
MKFSHFSFDNRFVNQLPADTESNVYSRQVEQAAYSFVNPTKVMAPQLAVVSNDVATILGFSASDLASQYFCAVFSGNELIDGMQPYAMCYGGHQFGQWAGQLGDGRAINLGEVVTKEYGYQTLQLKGAGATPYSRTADGLAVLRSSIREFLCSESMFHLGISTTRALSLCLTGEYVVRDMFYDGNTKLEQGAVVCRVSSSFMRFGSFQLPASRGNIPLLKQLVEYCIKSDFSFLLPKTFDKNTKLDKTHYLAWFNEICNRTCSLMVDWMRVGFVHGVMNTDNMSIIGETIDYGPYGWIDDFDLNWTPNTTDAQGRRYRFGAQAEISQWNLFQLANAIYPLIGEYEPLQQMLDDYAVNYQQQWQQMMARKLGFETVIAGDEKLFVELEQLLSVVETDMTIFYRQLAKVKVINHHHAQTQWLDFFAHCYYQKEQLDENYQQQLKSWMHRYITRLAEQSRDDKQRSLAMNRINPKYVLRNYLAQQAIVAAEQGDYSEIKTLQKILLNPYDEQIEFEPYANKRPEWARHQVGCSMLSCSS